MKQKEELEITRKCCRVRFQILKGDNMDETIQKLYNNGEITTNELLDKLIAFQLRKMEKHDKRYHLSEASEQAMENMIELVNIRYKRRGK